MNIIELRAQNFLNLKAIEIRPDGNAVILSGKNGAGKSSVLNAIFFALTGATADRPIRDGQDRAEVTIELGDVIVKKAITAKGARLEVTSKDGRAKYASPQALLDEIIGKLSFNPLAFAEMGRSAKGAREQREILLQLAGLDLGPLDAKKETLYEERAGYRRQMKKIEVLLETLVKPTIARGEKEHDLQAHIWEIQSLEEKKAQHDEHCDKIRQMDMQLDSFREQIKRFEDEIKRLEVRIGEYRDRIAAVEKEKHASVVPPDITTEMIADARKRLAVLEQENRARRDAEDYYAKADELAEISAVMANHDKEFEAIEAQKSEAVKAAKFPLADLSVDDSGVLFNGIPLSQVSKGESIRISTAIAMALNPKLRVIFVQDASLLDSEGMKHVIDLAAEKGYQVWLEKTDETGKLGIYIEDGEIKAVNGQEVIPDATADAATKS